MKKLIGILLGLFLVVAQPLKAETFSIEKIIIATDLLKIKETQLVEVLVRNSSKSDRSLICKLVVTLPNRNIVTFANKRFLAKAQTDTSVIIPYPIDAKGFGDYSLGARLYTVSGKPLVTAAKSQSKYFYALDPAIRKTPPKRRRGRMSKAEIAAESNTRMKKKMKREPVVFDPPDLKFVSLGLLSTSVLRGETTHVRIGIKNDGGDIAQNAEINLRWFFSQRPRRKIHFIAEKIPIISPGETKMIELPFTIPEGEQPGKYSILAKVDEGEHISEIDETNNEKVSDEQLVFGDIAMVSPENNHSFAEDGLFKFEWRSKKYNQFKVQISSDPTFTDESVYFEMPKEEKWTPSFTLNPMRGEMPTLALSMMDENEIDHLFWRIVAKDSTGKTTESQARKFYITVKSP